MTPTADELAQAPTANLKALVQKWRGEAPPQFGDTDAGAVVALLHCADDLENAIREIERMESEDGARTAETPETGALKACPFCGAFNPELINIEGWAQVSCRHCGCRGTEFPTGLQQSAISAWNRRAPFLLMDGDVEAMLTAYKTIAKRRRNVLEIRVETAALALLERINNRQSEPTP